MAKQVQKTSSKNLKLTIVNSINIWKKLPDGISKSKCNYHIKPFLKAGLVIKKGYGTWELTKLGQELLDKEQLQMLYHDTSFKAGKTEKKQIRGHGFMWRLKLPSRAFMTTKQRVNIIKNKNIEYDILKTGVIKTKLRDHNIHLGLRSIVVYFNPYISYIGKSAKDSYREAVFEFEKLIKKIEIIYNRSLKIRSKYRFKVCKNHYGDLNNIIAKHYKDNNKSIRIFDEGSEWLVIDFSNKEYIEAETTKTGRAKYDMDNIITPFMNKLHKNPKILDKVEKDIERMKDIIKNQQDMINYLIEGKSKGVVLDRFKY